ncbi:MAG: hypothetical protein JWQ84_3225 [Mucilaginibacter sp.]|jgi:hypothetical protein|nr:hypothetical protein [Mucilaginibacter sp.]MDB5018393.1 hypothetical protein [Mucilaginibacter sp.]
MLPKLLETPRGQHQKLRGVLALKASHFYTGSGIKRRNRGWKSRTSTTDLHGVFLPAAFQKGECSKGHSSSPAKVNKRYYWLISVI